MRLQKGKEKRGRKTAGGNGWLFTLATKKQMWDFPQFGTLKIQTPPILYSTDPKMAGSLNHVSEERCSNNRGKKMTTRDSNIWSAKFIFGRKPAAAENLSSPPSPKLAAVNYRMRQVSTILLAPVRFIKIRRHEGGAAAEEPWSYMRRIDRRTPMRAQRRCGNLSVASQGWEFAVTAAPVCLHAALATQPVRGAHCRRKARQPRESLQAGHSYLTVDAFKCV